MMKQFKHVKITDSELQRKYFTKQRMQMDIAGKEIMATRIAEHIREAFSKRKSSTITLQWKQDVVKTTASTGKHDTDTRMDETLDNKQENLLLLMGNDDENSNYNSDNSNCDNGENLKIQSS
jgi:hypothetical protein